MLWAHSSLLAPLFFIVTHLLLCECPFLHFITYILGSLIFERMLNLCVYTYKPWGFTYNSLSDSYFPKIMYYKTYVSCIYTKILIFDQSRLHYSWIFYSRMTYVSIRRFGHENPNLELFGHHLYFSLILVLIFINLEL